jgi:MFS family permease
MEILCHQDVIVRRIFRALFSRCAHKTLRQTYFERRQKAEFLLILVLGPDHLDRQRQRNKETKKTNKQTPFSLFLPSLWCNGRSSRNMMDTPIQPKTLRLLSPTIAFIIVSFSLGELGDGLNIFQGIYLVGLGWNEGAVGTALSLMGLTALIVQTWAGDLVDKTTIDRRIFLTGASIVTALSASMIFFVREGNLDHGIIFVSKIVEGVASSFIGPCLAALTLATFGPNHFDAVMASNILWGHIGSVFAAALAGVVAFVMYPNIKLCFLVLAWSALGAVFFVRYLPEGDPLMGRGFQGKQAMNEFGHLERLAAESDSDNEDDMEQKGVASVRSHKEPPTAASYWEVIADKRSFLLCITGFFFQ